MACLAATDPRLVLECAGQAAVAEHGPAILRRGIDLVVASVGALADEGVARELRSAAQGGGGTLLMAPGAMAGMDGLLAARLGGLASVTYVSIKPPEAWRGAAANEAGEPDGSDAERVIFEGSAREAALLYPKNANVAVSIGLAGLGLDATRVRLIASRFAQGPRGIIEAEGAFGRFSFDIFARASPDNPKSSQLTAYSLLQCARLGIGVPVFPLLGEADA